MSKNHKYDMMHNLAGYQVQKRSSLKPHVALRATCVFKQKKTVKNEKEYLANGSTEDRTQNLLRVKQT